MIEYAFVLLVSNTSLDEKYIGNFKSCEVAQVYYFLHEYEKYDGMRCLTKEYAPIPEGTPIKNIDMSHGIFRYKDSIPYCKFKRNCNE